MRIQSPVWSYRVVDQVVSDHNILFRERIPRLRRFCETFFLSGFCELKLNPLSDNVLRLNCLLS